MTRDLNIRMTYRPWHGVVSELYLPITTEQWRDLVSDQISTGRMTLHSCGTLTGEHMTPIVSALQVPELEERSPIQHNKREWSRVAVANLLFQYITDMHEGGFSLDNETDREVIAWKASTMLHLSGVITVKEEA